MKTLTVWGVSFLLAAAAAQADEGLRRVQEELRKRNLYFGEIDGRKTKETTAAIGHYQQRKGFPVTGEADADTLSSLRLALPPNGAAPWPDVPVLKSDAARQVSEDDRKFLEAILASDPEVPVAEGPPTVEPVKTKTETAPGAEESAGNFVREYLAACQSKDLAAEMAFYADRVDYFDHGVRDRNFIERDVRKDYARWPDRRYELLTLEPPKTGDAETVVKFRIAFHVKNRAQAAKGKTDNTFKIREVDGKLRFVSLKERRAQD